MARHFSASDHTSSGPAPANGSGTRAEMAGSAGQAQSVGPTKGASRTTSPFLREPDPNQALARDKHRPGYLAQLDGHVYEGPELRSRQEFAHSRDQRLVHRVVERVRAGPVDPILPEDEVRSTSLGPPYRRIQSTAARSGVKAPGGTGARIEVHRYYVATAVGTPKHEQPVNATSDEHHVASLVEQRSGLRQPLDRTLEASPPLPHAAPDVARSDAIRHAHRYAISAELLIPLA